MMKRISKLLLVGIVAFGLMIQFSPFVQAAEIAKTEEDLLGETIVVYGGNLNEARKAEVKDILNVEDGDTEYNVTGQDIAHYINGDPNSNMYSSVKITPKEEGHGIAVQILTANNITKVTADMYRNALLTAGIENAVVEVGSPIQVTGESALSGIYKAYDASGVELEQGRMEVANDELEITSDLADKEGLSEEKVTALMTEIKKVISEEKPATREDVERIVSEQLDRLEITLNDDDRQLLIDLFDKMRDLDIDFGKVKDQLEDITSTIKDKLDDLDLNLDEGFLEKVKAFFNDIIDWIASFFK